jgi:hypothetical protein
MCVCAPLLLVEMHSAQAAVPWPGLPTPPDNYTVWAGSEGNGLSGVAKAQQWIRIPAQAVAAVAHASQFPYPPGDPRKAQGQMDPLIFLSSPAGSSYGYGESVPITVHTVAFGAIPVTARVQIEQIRDSDGLPVPLKGIDHSDTYWDPQPVRPGFSSTVHSDGLIIAGQVTVRVRQLSVDGVDIGLKGSCQTDPLDLNLTSKDYWAGDPLNDPQVQGLPVPSHEVSQWAADHGEGSAYLGGAVQGTVTIPPFSGCVTETGDDVSRVLTGAISGPGNEIKIGVGSLGNGYLCASRLPNGFKTTRAPFSGDPSDCPASVEPPTFTYPSRSH